MKQTTFGINQIDEYLNVLAVDKSPNTIIVYSSAIKKMIEYLNIKDFSDIERIISVNLRSHQSNMKVLGLSFSSINTNMRPIKAMFNWLVENEYLKKSPMKKVKDLKEPKKVLAYLSEDEQKEMIGVCKNDLDKLIVAIFISTGLRREELANLTLNSFNSTHILISVKGNKERELILQPPVIDLLNKYLTYRNKKYGNKTDALLVSKMGRHFSGNGIYKKIKSILKLTNISKERIKYIHVHTTRHTFCTNMLEITSLPQVQKMMGHERSETTMRYAHVRNSAIDQSMLKQKDIL